MVVEYIESFYCWKNKPENAIKGTFDQNFATVVEDPTMYTKCKSFNITMVYMLCNILLEKNSCQKSNKTNCALEGTELKPSIIF